MTREAHDVARVQRALVSYYQRRLHPNAEGAAKADIAILKAAQGPRKRVAEALETRHFDRWLDRACDRSKKIVGEPYTYEQRESDGAVYRWTTNTACPECGCPGVGRHYMSCPNWEGWS